MARQLIAGLVILTLVVCTAYYFWPAETVVCQICRRPMHQATSYFVTLEGGGEVELCCPRCGLRFQTGRSDVESAVVADYSTQERVAASKAFYVVGSSVHPCCSEPEILKDRSGIEYERTWDRCLPSVIAFKSKEDAEMFMREKGGTLASWDELATETRQETRQSEG